MKYLTVPLFFRPIPRVYFWWYRRKNSIPHPREINPFIVKQTHLRELAKMYCSGFDLNECAALIKQMKKPIAETKTRTDGTTYVAMNITERMFYGEYLTHERLRQLVWKIWREQRVVRDSGQTP